MGFTNAACQQLSRVYGGPFQNLLLAPNFYRKIGGSICRQSELLALEGQRLGWLVNVQLLTYSPTSLFI